MKHDIVIEAVRLEHGIPSNPLLKWAVQYRYDPQPETPNSTHRGLPTDPIHYGFYPSLAMAKSDIGKCKKHIIESYNPNTYSRIIVAGGSRKEEDA